MAANHYSESFSGNLVCLPGGGAAVLLGGALPAWLPAVEVDLYFGFYYLYYELDALLVTAAIDDFRRRYDEAHALRFLLRSGHRYPRGDALGLRLSTMQPAEEFIRDLDLARGLRVFASVGSAPPCLIDAAALLQADVPEPQPIEAAGEGLPTLLFEAVPCFRLRAEQLGALTPLLPR